MDVAVGAGATRVYIAGAGGMLGAAVVEAWTAEPGVVVAASDLAPRADWRHPIELSRLDVADHDAFAAAVDAFEPDLLVNLAAETDLERCERDPERAWASNAVGAENAGRIAERLGIPHVYVSTAGVFGGEKDVYDEDDEPDPLTVYARSKRHGEVAVQEQVTRHYVLRAGWMMGGGPGLDKKFVEKVHRQIRDGATTIHAVTDLLGSPTFTRDFARGMVRVVREAPPGLYHQVCHGSASRFDVAVGLVDELGLAGEVEVVPVTSEFFAADYFARRPDSEQLVNARLGALGLDTMRSWREALAEYAEDFRPAG